MESISIEIVRLEKDAKNNSIKGRKKNIDLQTPHYISGNFRRIYHIKKG